MADAPRASDVRLRIPAAGPYRALAAELAARFAEYSGSNAGAASQLRKAVERIAASVANGAAPDASIDFDMSADDRVITVRASSGSRSDQATCPLFE
jgi:hypothetical protein